MIDRPEFVSAAGTVSLGMLIDEALIATIRYQEGRELGEPDRVALKRIRQLLLTVSELGSRQVIRTDLLRSMTSIATLDATFQAVSRVQDSQQEFSAFTAQLAETAGAILDNGAKDGDVVGLRELLERLAVVTFEDSKEAVQPSRHKRVEWIRRASNS